MFRNGADAMLTYFHSYTEFGTVVRIGAMFIVFLLIASAISNVILQADVPLRDGTPVPVKLAQFISSETSISGDLVHFQVADDVLVDGRVVIKRGTAATGTIAEAFHFRMARGGWLWWWRRPRPGRLIFTVDTTTSVDGQTIRLRSPSPVGGGIPERGRLAEPRPPLIRWAHEGARFEARVEGEYRVVVPQAESR